MQKQITIDDCVRLHNDTRYLEIIRKEFQTYNSIEATPKGLRPNDPNLTLIRRF